MIFLLIAVAGLAYVKWLPYTQRAWVAASSHSIGTSILMGSAAQAPEPSWAAALDYARAYGNAIWKAMVLGLLLGSAVQVLVPGRWITRLIGAGGFRSVGIAGLLSLPGMMCTCCAAPVVTGLRACRATPGAAVAFWLGNTMLNPATLVFMGFVLGWNWTFLRLALGVVMVFGVGYLVDRVAGQSPAPTLPFEMEAGSGAGGKVFTRWLALLARMSVRLVPEYAVLVLLMGAARAWLFPHIGPEIGNELLWIAAFAVAGALFVIPTAGEVPIVQGMLLLGLGTGPAAALLLTLPPISVPSMAMVAPAFRTRILALVALCVVAIGMLASALAIGLGF
jgi:uncharacterized protein